MKLSEMIKKYNKGIGEGWTFDTDRYRRTGEKGYTKGVKLDDRILIVVELRYRASEGGQVGEIRLSKWEATEVEKVYRKTREEKTQEVIAPQKRRSLDKLKEYTRAVDNTRIKEIWLNHVG